ncbi:hypothetical protein MTP99_018167 [Tenebrio molitor]|nr:hypothetical protein MTP99_018167 [Tenebrio molitor]
MVISPPPPPESPPRGAHNRHNSDRQIAPNSFRFRHLELLSHKSRPLRSVSGTEHRKGALAAPQGPLRGSLLSAKIR